MHVPIGTVATIIQRFHLWVKAILGLGFNEYPMYIRSSDKKFDEQLLSELVIFLNDAFEVGYKCYNEQKVKTWIKKSPGIYVCVIDYVRLSRKPTKPQIVGTYKLLPLTQITINKLMKNNFEIIDITSRNLEKDLKNAAGIWIGDLRVLSPFLSTNGSSLGNHLMEQIKSEIRELHLTKPIFCRSERKDIQDFLLRRGFIALKNEDEQITGKTIIMLPSKKQINKIHSLK